MPMSPRRPDQCPPVTLQDATPEQLIGELEKRTDGYVYAGLLKSDKPGELGSTGMYAADGNPFLCRVLLEELKERLVSGLGSSGD